MAKKNSVDYDLTLEEKFEMTRKAVRAVTRGFKTSRAILGTKGVGKSFTVIDEIHSEIERFAEEGKILKCQVITGGVKDALSFYATLCDFNDPNMVLVFDDINTILTNKDCREILRAAVSNEPERLIAFLSSNKVIRGMKGTYFNKIKFKSKVIVITNILKHKIDTAILSRMSPIEITAEAKELFEWVGKNLKEAPPANVPFAWKEEVYNFIKNEITIEKLQHFDFRAFEDCMLWFSSCVDSHQKDERGDKIITIDEQWKKYVKAIVG